MKNGSLSGFCLVRRPICDRNQSVIAYELLCRENDPRDEHKDEETSSLLVTSLVDYDLRELVGNKPAIMSLSRGYVAGEIPLPDDLPQVGFEIADGILPDEQLYASLKRLSDEGKRTLTLSNMRDVVSRKHLIELVDYVKIDVTALSYEELQQQVSIYKTFNVKLIAEGVSIPAVFDSCKDLGFFGFIGYFFCMPRKTSLQRIPTNRLTILQVISELENSNISVKKLESIIEKDVTFSYRILRFMNSAYFGLQKPINSLKKAITLAGMRNIKTWAIILAHSRISNKPHELMTVSLIRAKMCEILSSKCGVESESAFLVGLFSTLDALLDRPMNEILDTLPLGEEIKQALLNKDFSIRGTLSDILQAVMTYERADWRGLMQLNFDINMIKAAYIESISWNQQITSGLLAEDKVVKKY